MSTTADTLSPLAGSKASRARSSPRRIHPVLDKKLQGLQSRQKSADAAAGSAILVLLLLGLLIAGAMVDWIFDLPRTGRIVLLAIDACGLGYIAWREVIEPLVQGPSDDELALRVEEAKPIFKSRLISSVQLMRPGAIREGVSKAVARQMIIETAQLAKSMNFTEIVRLDRPIKLGIGAGAAVILLGALVALGGPIPQQLLERQLLMNVPLPHFTDAECYTNNFTIATGDSALVGAVAKRWVPKSGTVEVHYASGQSASFPVERVAGPGPAKFTHAIDAVQEPFDYRIRLNDGYTPYFHVDVQPPPAVVSLDCQEVYPRYAHRADEPMSAGNLVLLQGSQLRIEVKSSKPLLRTGPAAQASRVHFAGSDTDVPLQVDPADPTRATVTAPILDKSTGMAIRLVDSAGLNSRDPVVYPLQLVADEPPTITLTFPLKKDELATAQAKFVVGFHATDDVGVNTITLKYQLDNGPVQSVPLKIEPGLMDLKGRYVWNLSLLTPTAAHPHLLDTEIRYWVEAADANDVTGPGVTDSERYTLHIVDEAQKRQELSTEMDELLSGFKSTTDDAESVEKDLGDIVYEKK